MKAICDIIEIRSTTTICMANVCGTVLPVEIPTLLLHNVINDERFEWEMKENGEIKAEDITPYHGPDKL
jgi:hypothetical protein